MTTLKLAVFIIGVYLLLVLAPLLILLIGEVPSGSGFWWDFSMALGFSGMAMMGVQFLLTARFRRITAPFGIDIIYYFHRYLAVLAFAFIFLHYLIIRVDNVEALGEINPMHADWYMSAGRLALLLFAVLIISSLWRKFFRIHYDQWRMLHIALAVSAFSLALAHIVGVGYYVEAPAKRWLWGGYTFFWLMLIVYVRVLKPWKMCQQPYRVKAVRQELGNSWTLVLQPEGHGGMSFLPGQFAWLSLGRAPWSMEEHPFSISSSASHRDNLEFTIKELGDFTRTIKQTQVGEIAYLDGPYGVFSVDRYANAPGFIFIAGGVGAAPIVSMLRTLADRHEQRPLWFIYGNKTWQDVIFREQLQDLQARLNLTLVHVLEQPTEDWQGESGFISKELLQKILPNNAPEYEYFLCGPKRMSDAVQLELHMLHVPLGKVHFELFDMV